MANKSKGFMDKLWDVFSSMKMGLVLLGLVALGAGIGTFFPQEALEPDKAKTVSLLWKLLGFTNVYASAWFQLLLGLLCINLIVCSIQRFGGIYNQSFKITVPISVKDVPQRISNKINGQNAELKNEVLSVLKSKGYRLTIEERPTGWGFIAYKRRLGTWGSFITHLSFVVLIIGALLGSVYGFKGYFMAGPGSTVSLQNIAVDKGMTKHDFSILINATEDRKMPGGEQENWYSDLSIIESGKEVVRKTISVNHPLTYKGVTFYQSSFRAGARFTAKVNGEDIPIVLPDRGGGSYKAPGTDLHFIIGAMRPDPKDPIILYQVYKEGQATPVQEGPLKKGESVTIQGVYNIKLDDYAGYTGIQVKSDPGVNVIWLGSGLLLLGLILSFYWRPMFILGVFEEEVSNQGVLTIGARSGKLVRPIQEEFEEISQKIRTSKQTLK